MSVSLTNRQLQVPTIRKVQFFASEVADTTQRLILRHPANGRRQDQVLNEYVKSVQTRGIVPGVRGQAWLLAPDGEKNQHAYLALTFATLCLGNNNATTIFAATMAPTITAITASADTATNTNIDTTTTTATTISTTSATTATAASGGRRCSRWWRWK